jgi:hypothetical protein
MGDDNTESNNSDPLEPSRFGEEIPEDTERQAELVDQSVQQYRQMQRYLEQEAEEYLARSVYLDYCRMDHDEE